jgi:prenyltransferase beta subunit
LRLEMLQVARLSPKLLGEAADLVADFLRSQQNSDGGFKDRAGGSDLYYTVFGVEGLIALRADIPHAKIAEYLLPFGDGGSLDFVHLGCLARCWANLPPALRAQAPREQIAARIERFRTADGGYAASGMTNEEIRIHERGQQGDSSVDLTESGTLYGCFLAAASYQDLELLMPDPMGMLKCIHALRAADGGYSNQRDVPMGLTPTTAAAATLLRHLGQPADPSLAKWLLDCHRAEGGFLAMPDAPIPDLLSTATALHALAGMQVDFSTIKEPSLDFIDTLWTNKGSFHGNWTDDLLDTEYTYYGLLALGHLSL